MADSAHDGEFDLWWKLEDQNPKFEGSSKLQSYAFI